MEPSRELDPCFQARSVSWFFVAVVATIGAVVLYRSPYSASDLIPPPDAVEYAMGAQRFVTEGSYTISLQGRRFPPRYPPWFSVIFLAPAYAIAGLEPGNAIYPVTVFGIAGLAVAFILGRCLSGDNGGVLAALAVLCISTYRFLGRSVMTDVTLYRAVAWSLSHVRSPPCFRREAKEIRPVSRRPGCPIGVDASGSHGRSVSLRIGFAFGCRLARKTDSRRMSPRTVVRRGDHDASVQPVCVWGNDQNRLSVLVSGTL